MSAAAPKSATDWLAEARASLHSPTRWFCGLCAYLAASPLARADPPPTNDPDVLRGWRAGAHYAASYDRLPGRHHPPAARPAVTEPDLFDL